MFVECQGNGSPTVLISGKGNGAAGWFDVLDPDDPVHEHPGDDLGAGMGDIHPSEDAVFPSVSRFTRVARAPLEVRLEGIGDSAPALLDVPAYSCARRVRHLAPPLE